MRYVVLFILVRVMCCIPLSLVCREYMLFVLFENEIVCLYSCICLMQI